MNTRLILDFLDELRDNNRKEWMEANRPWYEEAKQSFVQIVGFLIEEISRFDPSVRAVAAKSAIFRINRDIRFSADKSPYKTNFGAFIAENGRRGPGGGYYLHLQPRNESFIAGGVYMPAPDILKKIRQEVDYNPEELKAIVSDKKFKDYFGAVQGEKLKTAPKGYPADHPNIEFLKLKSYIALHKIADEEVVSDGFLAKTVDVFQTLYPFNEYLNVAIS